jgi:hypothetical protein
MWCIAPTPGMLHAGQAAAQAGRHREQKIRGAERDQFYNMGAQLLQHICTRTCNNSHPRLSGSPFRTTDGAHGAVLFMVLCATVTACLA